MPTQLRDSAPASPRILPCQACRYDLNGLGSAAYLTCPECGLEQPRRTSLPPWPCGWTALAWQCGVTLAMCNLCLLTLLAMALFAPVLSVLLLVLTVITFLSGPVVPIVSACVLARRHGTGGIHWFIPLGWLTNFFIGAGYLVIAFVVGILSSF